MVYNFFTPNVKLFWLCTFIMIVHLLAIPTYSKAQERTFNQARFNTVVISETVLATAGTIALHYLWYKKFPKSRFHFFNDNNEWLSMDKIGHATTAYNFSAIQYDMMRWSGVNKNSATWIGGLTALGLQTMIEFFDGYSAEWGFSKGDMLANLAGTALFMGQQFAWGEQRMSMRFSFHKTIYAKYNPSELGANKWQRWLKDYNGQTYWLSINPYSFLRSNTSFPSYLNVAIGCSAEGMIGARSNPSTIKNIAIPTFERKRKWLLAADVDVKRININTSQPQTLLNLPAAVKLPTPTVEFKKGVPAKFYWLYF